MVGNQHVAGSPFLRDFTAGPADAQRTVVLRHCSTVVCTANVAHVLYIEPRDEYSNVCTYRSGEDPLEVSLAGFCGFTVNYKSVLGLRGGYASTGR